MPIFRVIPFIKLQMTLKQQLNVEKKRKEKWDGELSHLSVSGWASQLGLILIVTVADNTPEYA